MEAFVRLLGNELMLTRGYFSRSFQKLNFLGKSKASVVFPGRQLLLLQQTLKVWNTEEERVATLVMKNTPELVPQMMWKP